MKCKLFNDIKPNMKIFDRMKTIKLPLIENLEQLDFDALSKTMETGAAKLVVDTVNWPEYPYTPLMGVSIAHSSTHLVILYNVRGFDLRAAATEDNGSVWEDSCCEFFVSHPSDGTYYNFEMNCIGTLLAAKRTGRNDAVKFTPEQLARIIRHSTLPKFPVDIPDKIYSWSTALCIPFDLIGVDSENLPESLRANFYKCGDLTAHPHFLSWNPIGIEKPDFHRPDFFGKIIL